MTKNVTADRITLRRYRPEEAREIRATVETIYKGSYTDAIASGDPFDSVDAFMGRFDAYTKRRDFDMVVAYIDGEALGQTWGWPLDERAREGWWAGLISTPDPDFTREDGHRTFALSEIMVRQEYTGRHIARTLHNELLAERSEERATLLVEPENERAYRAYLHWGWRKVAQLRPAWPDSPLFDVLVLSLPLASRSE
jgi:ribosomal protein S18 acetylase RimI-like enzyme